MIESIKHKQRIKGKVVSSLPDKTAIVEVARFVKHPRYKKYFKRSKKYSAHDETNQYKKGDIVVIESARPVSKTKKWTIVSKV